RARGSPKPGTGRPQYTSSRKARRFSRATRAQYSRKRTERSHATIESRADRPDPACALSHHRRVRLALKRSGELRHVRHRPIDAVLVRRMRVGLGLQTLRFGPRVLAPDLRPPEEHALLRREGVD